MLLQEENSKTELYRNHCLQTNYVRKCVKYFSKLFYCCILLQEQTTAEAFQTDIFFTQASISSLVYQLEQTVTGFQLAPDVWDNLNLYCHLNQVDVSLSRSKSKICTIFKFTCRKAIICRTIFRMYLPPCVLNIHSFH